MVAASSIEGGLKMTSEGMSSSAGGQFGSGALGGSGMVSNLVLNSTEIKATILSTGTKKISL